MASHTPRLGQMPDERPRALIPPSYGTVLQLGAEHARAVEDTARRAVDLFDRHVRERIQARGGDPEAAELELLRLFEELLEASGTLVRHHFQRTLLRVARERIERSRE